jgi:hypothetical protein
MKGNPKVIDYLNKALRHELTAVINTGYTTACWTTGATKLLQSSGAKNQSRKCSMPTNSSSGRINFRPASLIAASSPLSIAAGRTAGLKNPSHNQIHRQVVPDWSENGPVAVK